MDRIAAIVAPALRHAKHLHHLLPQDHLLGLFELPNAGRAIADVVKPARMNYALLGNQEPLLHFHWIPRPAWDPSRIEHRGITPMLWVRSRPSSAAPSSRRSRAAITPPERG